jgi:hypothetical protein
MIYWRILLEDGRTGWQVMDANLNNAVTVDDDNVPLTGAFTYSVTDTTLRPVWAV